MNQSLDKVGNVFLKPILASPLHFLASKRVMLITVEDRNGKKFTTSVRYCRDGQKLTFFTYKDSEWWKNLRNSPQVTMRVEGEKLTGKAEIHQNNPYAIQKAVKKVHPRMKPAKLDTFSRQVVMVDVHVSEKR
jgi:uncharacterized pyridoxamine 5'-phosphate oxidase family protein